jgi:hypothetical protein
MRDDSIGVTGIDMWLAHVRHTHTYDQLRLITFEIASRFPQRFLFPIENEKPPITHSPDWKLAYADEPLIRAMVAR